MSEFTQTSGGESGGELSLSEAVAMMTADAPEEQDNEQAAAPDQEAPAVEGGEAPEPDAAAPEGEAEQTEAPAQTFKVKVNGIEEEVPLQELLNGYSRTQDYTAKTEAAAAKAREAEQLQQQYATGINQMVEMLKASVPKAPDLALLDSNPVEYMRQKALFDNGQAHLNAYQAEQTRLSEEAKQKQAEQYAAFFKSQQLALQAKLPDWKDEAKAKAEQAKIREHLAKLEFTDEEMNQASDHRMVIMARESMLYRQLIAQQKQTAAVVQKAPPKVERPGVATTGIDQRTALAQRFNKNPNIDDGARLIASLLG